MKRIALVGWSSALCLGAVSLPAQETSEVEILKQQLRQATESFEKTVQEQRRVIDALQRRLEALEKLQTNAAATDAIQGPPPGAPGTAGVASPEWRPSDPIRLGRDRAYMDTGVVGTVAAGGSTADDIAGGTQLGGHDPNQRGFTLQTLEANFTGAIDPYFRGQANISYALDEEGESLLELEEAWMETMSLPWGLQLRAGQLLTEFGRQNSMHLHSWAFVDTPLISGRLLGPDGLRNPGARISWLMPTPFYSELMVGVQNSQGETATSFRSDGDHGHGGGEETLPFAYRHADNDRGVHHLGDLLFSPRYALSFDPTESQVLLLGASGAFGPNSRGGDSAGDTTTRIYGADVTWKWKSPRAAGGFPQVTWRTEAMLRRYDAGAFDWDEDGDGAVSPGEVVDNTTGLPALLPGETLSDQGFYTQLIYGFRKGWEGGLRFDYVTGKRAQFERMDLALDGNALGRDPQRAERWRLSPNLTWYPSEYSKIRLQYNYDDRSDAGVDHSVWLQLEFSLGAHAAHKF